MPWRSGILALSFLLSSISGASQSPIDSKSSVDLVVLGTVQDAGSPQIGCNKKCCAHLWDQPDASRMVVSLGLIDRVDSALYLLEATPDLTQQWSDLQKYSGFNSPAPDGIFLTHAHIGHYTGLMYLGKEAMNSSEVPVYAMPRMKRFLEDHGPWKQLVSNGNIELNEIQDEDMVRPSSNISIEPFLVPHRDEFSETIGFIISGPNKRALFIPDIDKWDKWEQDIQRVIAQVDIAFLDGTFYDAGEIPGRDMSEIPHPFIAESMNLFEGLPAAEKDKIHFIHFNHTNPVLDEESEQYKAVLQRGYHIAHTHDTYGL